MSSKYRIAIIIGFLKVFRKESAVRIHRDVEKLRGCLRGRNFWAQGYNISTIDLKEEQIRKYIQEQEKYQQDEGRLFE